MERGWIFLSHSHMDVDLVRKVRNHFENLGFEPLMFFLKCLTDDSEIDDLIKREILSREWFVYLDSPNARESKWVQAERDFIEKCRDKKVFVIDLSKDLDEQLAEIERIASQMKVFISCAHADLEIKERIKKAFVKKDMQVITADDLDCGVDWSMAIGEEIQAASHNGFVALLISENSINSQWVAREIELAKRNFGKIVPIYVDDCRLSNSLLYQIGELPSYSVSKNSTDEEIEEVVERVLNGVELLKRDFKDTLGYQSAKTIHLPEIALIDRFTFLECSNLECVYVPDTVVYISDDAFENHPNILIKCSKDSYTERYCIRKNIKYQII